MQIGNLQLWFDRLQSFLPNIPNEIWLAAFFVPVVLALFSRRSFALLGSVLTAGVALLVMLRPNSVTFIIATGAYASSFLVAIFGIQTKRKDLAVRKELLRLRSELRDLREAYKRQFLLELKGHDKIPAVKKDNNTRS